jgi:hypothetical protein
MFNFRILSVLTTILILTSCGGGGGSSSTSSNAITVGTFTDAGLVSGLQYQTATQSGITDANGKFNYVAGETVTFKIGNIILGQAIAGPALNTFSLVGMSPPLTSLGVLNKTPSGRLFQQAINISVFLQTLDTDSNPQNGISIPSQVVELAASTTLNFNQQPREFAYSFALKQFMARSRAAGLWGGSRAIALAGYATNQLYTGLKLTPTLFATSRYEGLTSTGSRNSSATYAYDESGNLIETKFYDISDVLQDKFTTTFDARGNRIETKSFDRSDVVQYSSTYTYNSNGWLIESSSFDGNGVLQDRRTYSYDSLGNEIESRAFYSAGALQYNVTNAYDASGNRIETKSYSNGALTSRTTYAYDANGKNTALRTVDGNDVLQYRSTSIYDSRGNLTEFNSFNSSDALDSRYTYVFDDNGNVIENSYFDGRNVLQYKYTSTYDVNGNRTENKSFIGNDVLLDRTAYLYDVNGNRVEAQSFNGNDVLQSKTLYTVARVLGWANLLDDDD